MASFAPLIQKSREYLGFDIAEWTLIVTILTLIAAVAVVPMQEFLARRRASVVIESGGWPTAPQLVVKLTNTGKPTLVFHDPARIIIVAPSIPGATPVQMPEGNVPHGYPIDIVSGDKLLSLIGQRDLAKELRIRGCADWCWIHGEYANGFGKPYRTKQPFLVPVWEWHPPN